MIEPPAPPHAGVSDSRRSTNTVSDRSQLAVDAENPRPRIGLLDTSWRLVKLARPAGAWIPPLLPLVGYGWAHWERALPAWRPEAIGWLVLSWVALNAATLWLNAALDQDRGEVLFGSAVEVPPLTVPAAGLGFAAAIALALGAGVSSALISAACVALSVLYSHPRTAWKANPVLGPVVNVVGYGVLSPLAGFVVVGGAPTTRGAMMLALLALTSLGWTFAAQAFQQAEDRARGDRTLVVTHGPAVALGAARVCFAAVGLTTLGLTAVGWLPAGLWLAAPAVALVDLHLAVWARLPDGGTEAWARRQAWLGLLFGALCITGAALSYVTDSLSSRPVAGLGTAHGYPRDRLLLPPAQLRPLDARDRRDTGRAYRPR